MTRPIRRLRPTIARQPSADAPEGVRAAFWRENQMKLSRPALAELLGMEAQAIDRHERMAKIPKRYRLACAALAAHIDFDWNEPKMYWPI